MYASYSEYTHNTSAWQPYNVVHVSDSVTWHLLIKLDACHVPAPLKQGHLPVMWPWWFSQISTSLNSCQLQLCITYIDCSSHSDLHFTFSAYTLGHQLWPTFCCGNRKSAYTWISLYASIYGTWWRVMPLAGLQI